MQAQPGEADLKEQIEATIIVFARLAAACDRSPPAPPGTGWGVPDWRDASAYPTAHELDDLEWRWEFLRRNHGYRLDWLRTAEEFQPCPRDRYFQGAYGLFGPIDPRLSIRSMPGFDSPIGPKKKTIIAYRSSGRAPFLEVILSNRSAEFRDLERIVRRPPLSTDFYVRYDLSRPIGPQTDEIKSLLMQQRREIYGEHVDRVRQRRAHWPLYLRLLDAADDGASYKDTLPILRVGRTEQGARDQRDAAEHLRDEWRH